MWVFKFNLVKLKKTEQFTYSTHSLSPLSWNNQSILCTYELGVSAFVF